MENLFTKMNIFLRNNGYLYAEENKYFSFVDMRECASTTAPVKNNSSRFSSLEID